MTIPIDVLFFVIPIGLCIFFAQTRSDLNGYMGSDRDWFYLIMMPIALVVSFASWAIYLKWFQQ